MAASEQFLEYLRDALAHLYDPNRLRRSPLMSLFGLADQANPYLALQRVLTDAIAALEPKADVPSHAPQWRTYELLFCRYVQQLGGQEVADQLGLSVRQLRRAQHYALDTLAQRLWDQYELEARPQPASEAPALRTSQANLTIDGELAWLKDAPLGEPAHLAEELAAILSLVGPLSLQRGVRVEVETTGDPLAVAVHPAALNQMLLSVVSVAISWAAGGQVRISSRQGRPAEISVRAERAPVCDADLTDNDRANLDIARKLAAMTGGRLSLTTDTGTLLCRLDLPAYERVVVLAIDDNADVLRLLQRHTAGTRYQIVGTSDPEGVFGLVERFSPRIIVLDVMMPRVDGWKVLGRLRQHPLTSHIPVIVCTILAQEELALSLGASAYVRKPLTQQALLAALNDQASGLALWARAEPGSR